MYRRSGFLEFIQANKLITSRNCEILFMIFCIDFVLACVWLLCMVINIIIHATTAEKTTLARDQVYFLYIFWQTGEEEKRTPDTFTS